jgi:hypothetical protein
VLVALAIPAAGLAGPETERRRRYWLKEYRNSKSQWTKPDVIRHIGRLQHQVTGLWRGLVWIYASLPCAAIALTRTGSYAVSLSDPVIVRISVIFASLALALIVMSAIRLVPLTWELLQIDITSAAHKALEIEYSEELRQSSERHP